MALLSISTIFTFVGFLCCTGLRPVAARVSVNETSWRPIVSCAQPFNILDFGAVGDGITVKTESIQAAINAAASCPFGGQVLVPFSSRNTSTFVCSSIFLDNNIELHIDAGAMILADPTINHWPMLWRPTFSGFGVPGLVNGARCTANSSTACTSWRPLKNVSITGSGIIDGNGFVWWAASTWWPTVPRPFLLEFAWVDGLVITGVSLLHSGTCS